MFMVRIYYLEWQLLSLIFIALLLMTLAKLIFMHAWNQLHLKQKNRPPGKSGRL